MKKTTKNVILGYIFKILICLFTLHVVSEIYIHRNFYLGLSLQHVWLKFRKLSNTIQGECEDKIVVVATTDYFRRKKGHVIRTTKNTQESKTNRLGEISLQVMFPRLKFHPSHLLACTFQSR